MNEDSHLESDYEDRYVVNPDFDPDYYYEDEDEDEEPEEEFDHRDFGVYFDIADELYDQTSVLTTKGPDRLTILDIDKDMREIAHRASQVLNLPWPPELAAAEEYHNTKYLGGR